MLSSYIRYVSNSNSSRVFRIFIEKIFFFARLYRRKSVYYMWWYNETKHLLRDDECNSSDWNGAHDRLFLFRRLYKYYTILWCTGWWFLKKNIENLLRRNFVCFIFFLFKGMLYLDGYCNNETNNINLRSVGYFATSNLCIVVPDTDMKNWYSSLQHRNTRENYRKDKSSLQFNVYKGNPVEIMYEEIKERKKKKKDNHLQENQCHHSASKSGIILQTSSTEHLALYCVEREQL